MASNTEILIKRSLFTDNPVTLHVGELAYSYTSNTIFIGNSSGTGIVNVGGQFYTSQIDSATWANGSSTIVKRDANGSAWFNHVNANFFSGSIYGNANTATQLQTARNFSINGLDVESTAVSFDGTGNVILQGNLKNTGVTAGTYGGQTEIPVFTVDSKGRISSAANVSVATTLNFAGDSGNGAINLLTDTLSIAGGAGITSTANDITNTVTLDVDNTVLRTNTAIVIQTIDGDVQISGNLIVSGNTTTVDVQTLNVSDPLIYLAAENYTSDVVDIGFVGNYYDGSTQRHAGVLRHAGDKQFYMFDNYDKEPSGNTVNPADASFRLATLHTNLTADTANANNVYAGTLFTSNRVYGDTSNNKLVLAPSTNYGPGVNDQYIIVDPTAPNHIHLRAGGTIDGSSADLFLGGENTGVQVSDSGKSTYIRANTHLWTFGDDASTVIPGNIFASNIPNVRTNNLVFFDSANGRFSYADDNALTPTSIANGSYSLSIQSTNGLLVHNGSGIQLANGTVISDTANGFFIDSLAYTATQNAIYDGLVFYNSNTKEIRYSYALDGGSF